MFDIVQKKISTDGSIKFVLKSKDDDSFVEAIYFMREIPNQASEGTICLSSQVGCKLHCAFCETGKLGFKRNLSTAELYEEINFVEASIGQELSQKITSYALMGMGEPLFNYENIIDFYKKAIKKQNIKLISLATSGICEKINSLAQISDVNFDLFLSLHSPFDEQRRQLMPIAQKYSVNQCLEACKNYALAKKQKVKINYLLLDGVNTSDEHIKELSKIIDKDLFRIQILLYNKGEEELFKRPSDKTALEIEKKLQDSGIETHLIISKGRDIGGGCGQMAGKI